MAKNIVGVDISAGGIRAVEVRDARGARPTVVKYDSIPLPEGAVLRGEVVEVTTVVTALRQLWTAGGFTSKDVVLGIGNHRVLARDLTVPRMSIERIRESLSFQVQDLLPVPVDQALLDFYPVSEGNSDQGPVVNGLLVAAVKESVDTNVRAVELAGLNPVDVDLIPFALCRVLLRGSSRRGVTAVIEVGSNTSTVVVARDGVPEFVRIISAGGRDLTDAVRSEASLTTEQAEATKMNLGLSTVGVPIAQQPIVEVIYKVAGELLNSLRQHAHLLRQRARPAADQPDRADGRRCETQGLRTGAAGRYSHSRYRRGSLRTRRRRSQGCCIDTHRIKRRGVRCSRTGSRKCSMTTAVKEKKPFLPQRKNAVVLSPAGGAPTVSVASRGNGAPANLVVGGEPRVHLLPADVTERKGLRVLKRRLRDGIRGRDRARRRRLRPRRPST